MTKFAFNIFVFASTEIFVFMTNYDFESRMSFDLISIEESTRKRILKIKDVNVAKKMKEVINFTKKKLAIAQDNQKKHADKNRADVLEYKEDDEV